MSTEEPTYYVVRNDKGEHSIWFADRPVPEGWATIGEPASKESCLAYIEEHWTDLNPAAGSAPQ